MKKNIDVGLKRVLSTSKGRKAAKYDAAADDVAESEAPGIEQNLDGEEAQKSVTDTAAASVPKDVLDAVEKDVQHVQDELINKALADQKQAERTYMDALREALRLEKKADDTAIAAEVGADNNAAEEEAEVERAAANQATAEHTKAMELETKAKEDARAHAESEKALAKVSMFIVGQGLRSVH